MKTVLPSGVIMRSYPELLFSQLLGTAIGVPSTGNCGFGLPEGVAVRSKVVNVGAQETGSWV